MTTTDPVPCESCGRLPLADDPRASAMLLEAIHDDANGRLADLETWVRLSSLDDRVAVFRWLERTIGRPPLSGQEARNPLRLALTAFMQDLAGRTWDPASEMASGYVPGPHPLMNEPLPDEDEPPSSPTTIEQVRAGLGGIFNR